VCEQLAQGHWILHRWELNPQPVDYKSCVLSPVHYSTDPRTVVCCMAVSMLLPVFCVQFLAVIYSAFLTMEKGKLKKLLIHRHQACRAAFKLLVTSQVPVLNVTPLMFWRHFHNS